MPSDDDKSREELLAELQDVRARLASLTWEGGDCVRPAGDELYRALSDAAFEALLLSDNGVCVGQNRAARRLFGYSDEEVLGRADVEWVHEDCREQVLGVVRGGCDEPCEAVALRKDGTTFPCEIRPSLVHRHGKTFRVIALRDISARKEAQTMREDFDRMFRHDMRTPLAGILAAPKVLQAEGNLTPFQEELLEAVEEACYKMLGMLRVSVDLPRLEDGTFEPEMSTFDLARLLRRILSLQEAYARSREIGTRVVAGGDATSVGFMDGDEVLIFSMMTNLYRNALEGSPRGGVVSIGHACRDGVVTIDIRNTGEVPPEVRDSFFEKYSTAGKPGGQGLGAYSAMLVARAHGGTIRLDTSTEGVTSVHVILPQRVR
ncbi:PAS domain-containing sensor histidine kinase [Pseudodesulfovibrio thermohalotolerans]|uniref:PAS domain-containing sensor histidine kinase n=1 Tax=Pseudodesulfovibrio thermohalotolerans TaxID=2880651 RepID=UPI00244103C3|nr:PAS domain-containing sensor histidine kinase [Pseudodesulfovibrio thermohalotolerans]WFS61763.1 PAS domain-containing sensor histidine kinase [Pseudodesulfovibrio thermohalotolerans]